MTNSFSFISKFTSLLIFIIFVPKYNFFRIYLLFIRIIRKYYSELSNPQATAAFQIIVKILKSCRLLSNFFYFLLNSYLQLIIQFLKVFGEFLSWKNFIRHSNQQNPFV